MVAGAGFEPATHHQGQPCFSMPKEFILEASVVGLMPNTFAAPLGP